MSKQPNILFIMADDHAAHAGMYLGETIPEPDNLHDDYANRAFAAQAAAMRVGTHMWWGDHNVAAHDGIRTLAHKLVYYYYDGLDQPGTERGDENWIPILGREPEWELFDLEQDPREMRNVSADPSYAAIRRQLTDELHRLQAQYGDKPYGGDNP